MALACICICKAPARARPREATRSIATRVPCSLVGERVLARLPRQSQPCRPLVLDRECRSIAPTTARKAATKRVRRSTKHVEVPARGTGQDRTGQDRTGQDRTGQDRTGQDRTGQDRTGQDRTAQDRTHVRWCIRKKKSPGSVGTSGTVMTPAKKKTLFFIRSCAVGTEGVTVTH